MALTPNPPTTTLLLPRTLAPSSHASRADNTTSSTSSSPRPHILLLASPSGSLAALVPLSESPYRRLLSVTNQLLPALAPHGGLNARAYRSAGADAAPHVGVETATGRVVVDGAVLARWAEVGTVKRAEVAGRGGYDGVAELREDLEGLLGWSGLAYF